MFVFLFCFFNLLFFVILPSVIFLYPVTTHVWLKTPGFLFCQLFRRVAAALPGMDTTQDKSREDSILACLFLAQFSITSAVALN